MSDTSFKRAAEFVGVIRSMIQHEDTLLNQRLTWMWTLQGLLFGGTSLLWKEEKSLVLLFAIVGLLSCISIGYSIGRGVLAIKELLRISRKFKKSLRTEYCLPPTIGARRKAIEWLHPARFLPTLFALAWLVVVALQLGWF